MITPEKFYFSIHCFTELIKRAEKSHIDIYFMRKKKKKQVKSCMAEKCTLPDSGACTKNEFNLQKAAVIKIKAIGGQGNVFSLQICNTFVVGSFNAKAGISQLES